VLQRPDPLTRRARDGLSGSASEGGRRRGVSSLQVICVRPSWNGCSVRALEDRSVLSDHSDSDGLWCDLLLGQLQPTRTGGEVKEI
jgi:hypothetical protein